MSDFQFIPLSLPTHFTDGDMECWPTDHDYDSEDVLYHKKLATKWLENTGSEVIGVPKFSSLPQGYRVYTKARLSGSIADRVDRYIYGHPNGRFTSPNQFWPHFLWLMSEGKGDCACIRCNSSQGFASAGDSTKFANRPKRNAFAASAMGKPTQILKDLVNTSTELRSMATYCDALEIDREANINIAYDGQLLPAERTPRLSAATSTYQEIDFAEIRHSFEPRIGEIVLFLRNDEGPVAFHRRTQTYLVMEKGNTKARAFPTWMAGVVSELTKEPVTLRNLRHVDDAKDLSGSIVLETLTKHGHGGKKPKSQAVPISRTRPFSLFRELLNGLPQSAWHKTITYAFKSAAGNAHCAAYRFEGKYPSGVFHCRSIWIGNELFRPGDAARIITRDVYEHDRLVVEDALVVSAITINASLLGGKMRVCYSLRGKRYSVTEPSEGTSRVLDTSEFTHKDLSARQLPNSMRGYRWYEMSGIDTVAPIQVLGRLYEKDAMVAMISSSRLDVGLKGVCEARKFRAYQCAKQRGMLQSEEFGLEWFRDRIQMLDVDNSTNLGFGNYFPSEESEILTCETLNFGGDGVVERDDGDDHRITVPGVADTEANVEAAETEMGVPIYPSKRARAS